MYISGVIHKNLVLRHVYQLIHNAETIGGGGGPELIQKS